MAYFLQVTGGSDEGKTFRLEPGESLIGRSPSAPIRLQDETVAWEHAVLREEDGRLLLQNLSALGTRVRGQRVQGDVRLRARDEIHLSERCRLVVEEKVGGRSGRPSPLVRVLLVVLAVVVVGGGGAWLLVGRGGGPARAPITGRHWRTAFGLLDERMGQWSTRGWFPEEARMLFQDGWRLEAAGNARDALERWQRLSQVLLTVRLPGVSAKGATISQLAGADDRALRIVMGHTGRTFQWDADDRMADALVWFVRQRAASSRQRVQAEESS